VQFAELSPSDFDRPTPLPAEHESGVRLRPTFEPRGQAATGAPATLHTLHTSGNTAARDELQCAERKSLLVNEPDEEQLVTRAAAGDRLAFRALYTKYRGTVSRLVFRMGTPNGDLDDAVQEVFVQVHRSLKDFRGQAKFSTWLHRVAVNVVLMQRRAQRVRPAFTDEADDTIVADGTPPDEDVERRERLRAFERVLSRLAEKKRAVFVLHDLEGVSPAEIATIVDAPVLTVRTRLFYARREIEAMLPEEPALARLTGTFAKVEAKSSKADTAASKRVHDA
jgi:RNA polymerase sigma-70 factor (ECF subfamily)